jgi:hypothetical protein
MAGNQTQNQQSSSGSVPIWLVAAIILLILFAGIILVLIYQRPSLGGGSLQELPTQAAIAEAPSTTPSPIGGPPGATETPTWTPNPSGTPYITPTFVNTAIAPEINTRIAGDITGGNNIISGGSGSSGVLPTITRAIPRSTQTAVAATATAAITQTKIAATATQFAATATQAAATATSAAATATPNPGILRGDYYNNKNLQDPIVVVYDYFMSLPNNLHLFFNWGPGSPDPLVNNDNFSARYRYTTNFSNAEYLFFAFTDDGVRVYVDGNKVIDQWTNAPNRVLYGKRSVSGGDRQVVVEYFEDQGDARLAVGWMLALQNAWIGEYYDNNDLGQPPMFISQDSAINFDWYQGSPNTLIPSDNFSIRWSRDYDFGSSGPYRFTVHVDDGVRIKVDGQTILNEWHTVNSPQTYTVERTLSGTKEVIIEYFEGSGNAQIQLAINRVSSTSTPVPTSSPTSTSTPTSTTTATATSTATSTSTPTSTVTITPTP